MIYINEYAGVCSLGANIETIFNNAVFCDKNFLSLDKNIIKGAAFYFGKVQSSLPAAHLRCNAFLLSCLRQTKIEEKIKKYDKKRVGIIIGTTNSGIDEFEVTGDVEDTKISAPAIFLKEVLGAKGPCFGVSTACSSGVKAFILALELMQNNIIDCAIVGGTDALSKMPSYGFNSLEILSEKPTNPFSANRSGISLGEGAALFLLEKEKCKNSISLKGYGSSSDAYHISTPEPSGQMAAGAIKDALSMANLSPKDINYINLHGTGTLANDLMEARVLFDIFGKDIPPSSSTKGLTGHCLGAAGAIEALLCCLLLQKTLNPNTLGGYYLLPHRFDGQIDPNLPKINLVKYGQKAPELDFILNNSFGFGGTNAVMILGRVK